MSLIQTIGDDLKSAMKSGDTFGRDALRMLQSALKNAAIEMRKDAEALSETEIQAVIKRMVKQRTESVTQYELGGRPELADKERREITLLSSYLPPALSREKVGEIVDEVLQSLGQVTSKDKGRIMGLVMKQVGGQADGSLVREVVDARLQ